MSGRAGDGERGRNHQPGPDFNGCNCTEGLGTERGHLPHTNSTERMRREFILLMALGEETKPFSVIVTTSFLSSSYGSRDSPSLQGLGAKREVKMPLLFQHKA